MERIFKNKFMQSVLYLCFIVAAIFFIVTFIGQRTMVDGHSMEDTLYHNDNLIVDKLTYRFKSPQRFDIIVFPHLVGDEAQYYIKRVIALPGESIYIDENGAIFINGALLEEPYGKETIQNAGSASTTITLKDDEYFVLGDNRNHSSDSRDPAVGLIHKDEIVGRALFRIYPFSKMGFIVNL